LLLCEEHEALRTVAEPSASHDDLRQLLTMFSARFVYSTDLLLLNIVHWDEAREYGHPRDAHNPGLTLPPGIVGVAAISEGVRQRFRLALRSLLKKGHIHGFVSSLRAIKGYGGKQVPFPELWSAENRNKLSEVIAISLTELGLDAARELATRYRVMQHWQVHRLMALDKAFAEIMTGKVSTENAAQSIPPLRSHSAETL
jgi:hypothetical protein